jgi:hypothetical protein
MLFTWIQKPQFIETVLVPLQPTVFSGFLKYHFPDMLWFISGMVLLRFIWFYNSKAQTVYIVCFYLIGFSLEISQLSDKIPGTFDWLDLLFIGIAAFGEGLLYKTLVLRRMA